LYRSPDGVGDVELAASALTSITAHLGLFGKAGLKAGETIYVSGGAGGVGSMVVQMAKAIGAKVIASAGGPDKSAYVRSIGADEVIDYKSENLKSALERSAPNGVDIWWDTVREPDFELAVARLAPRGRIVVMAGREAKPTFPIGPFYTRDCSLFGFAMFNADAETQAKSALEINHLFSSGKLKANVGVVLPLEKAAEAHALQEANTLRQEGTLRGKIVLKLA
jgi:NADPH2:quinone reductase